MGISSLFGVLLFTNGRIYYERQRDLQTDSGELSGDHCGSGSLRTIFGGCFALFPAVCHRVYHCIYCESDGAFSGKENESEA